MPPGPPEPVRLGPVASLTTAFGASPTTQMIATHFCVCVKRRLKRWPKLACFRAVDRATPCHERQEKARLPDPWVSGGPYGCPGLQGFNPLLKVAGDDQGHTLTRWSSRSTDVSRCESQVKTRGPGQHNPGSGCYAQLTVETGTSRRWFVPAAVGVLALLLVALGTLQYRWLSQVSEAERERLRAGARRHAEDFARDFDRQLAQAWAWLLVDGDTLRERSFELYAQRREQWRSLARYPELVRDVYLVERGADGPLLERFDPQAHDFRAQPWPEQLVPIRERVRPLLSAGAPGGTPSWREAADLAAGPALAFVVPVPGLQPPQARGQRRDWRASPVAGFTVIEFDAAAIRERVMPALIDRHFDAGHASDFVVSVLDVASGEHVAGALAQAEFGIDASADLFALRLGEAGSDLAQSLAMRRAARPPEPSQQGRAPQRRSRPALGGGDEPGRWRALVHHRSGSIEAVVTRTRTRNLAIGFGTLALLGASAVLLLASAQRSRRLAQQQMAFVAGVSHELRTPVAVIATSAANLADGVVRDPDQVRRYGTVIQKAARRLGETVSQVLEFAGPAPAARLPVDLAAAVREAAEAVEAERLQAGIELKLGLDPEAAVLGDTSALQRAVENLLTNAIKYGRPGTSVALELARSDGVVTLSVSDSGMGVPESERERIFEPFYRGSEAVAAQIRGNGLGLSLVRRIATAHGGSISLESVHGRGSRFILRLPSAGAPTEEHAQHSEPGVPQATATR